MPPLVDVPIMFAHRGARAHAPENTLEAFRLAAKLGATGIESDVWITADGVPVLDHDGVVGKLLRRRPISSVPRHELPPHIPSLAEYYQAMGTEFELSLDVKDADAVGAVIDVARTFGPDALPRLWLCHPDWKLVAGWRAIDDAVRLVDSTRFKHFEQGPERRAADLAEAGIDAINMHHSDWSGGLTTMFHRFGVRAFSWDLQFERTLDESLRMGMDAVYSDHVDRMVDRVKAFYG